LENLIKLIIDIYTFIVILSAIQSWFGLSSIRVIEYVNKLSDLSLNPVRRIIASIKVINLPVDISPIIVIFILQLIKHYI
jgi:uncharacterized protein YggT (Ycf19 family)